MKPKELMQVELGDKIIHPIHGKGEVFGIVESHYLVNIHFDSGFIDFKPFQEVTIIQK